VSKAKVAVTSSPNLLESGHRACRTLSEAGPNSMWQYLSDRIPRQPNFALDPAVIPICPSSSLL
jgi:hypothetical protein